MELDPFYKDLPKSLTLYTTIFQFAVFLMTKIHTIYLMGKYLEQYDYESEANYFSCVLYMWGSKYTPSIRYHFQYWRLVCPIFLHGSVAHIIGNMITQINYGYIVEKTQGKRRTVILYIVGGIGASLFSCVINNYDTAVGASGALFSILAFQLINLIKTYPNIDRNRINTFIFFSSLIFLSFFDSTPQVDVAAHFGGLLVGLLISTGYIFADSSSNKKKQYQYIFYGLVGILFIFLLMRIYVDNIQDEQICKEINFI